MGMIDELHEAADQLRVMVGHDVYPSGHELLTAAALMDQAALHIADKQQIAYAQTYDNDGPRDQHKLFGSFSFMAPNHPPARSVDLRGVFSVIDGGKP